MNYNPIIFDTCVVLMDNSRMLTPEDFRQQLQQSLSRIERERLARNREKEMFEQKKDERAWNREQWRNQAVLKIESEIPARQYLDELRCLMNPSEEMRRFGPSHGAIAYVFVYDKKTISSQRLVGEGRGAHHATFTQDYYHAIGVVLTHMKSISIIYPRSVTAYNEPYSVDSLNPLPEHEDDPYFWDNLEYFKGNSRRDFRRFTQKLTDFYTDFSIRATK